MDFNKSVNHIYWLRVGGDGLEVASFPGDIDKLIPPKGIVSLTY